MASQYLTNHFNLEPFQNISQIIAKSDLPQAEECHQAVVGFVNSSVRSSLFHVNDLPSINTLLSIRVLRCFPLQ